MTIIEQVYEGRQRLQWDTETRRYSRVDWQGTLLEERPFTDSESAFVDAQAAAATAESNRTFLTAQLDEDMVNLQTLLDTDNAVINGSPAPYLKLLARVLRRVIRILLKRLEART